MSFFRHLGQLMGLMQLPRDQRRIVFYSEGPAYWGHLQPLLQDLLDSCEWPLCYISSSTDDPGLQLQHPRLHTFITDLGWIRNWLFENIDTDLLLMTMPDLGHHQIKRSRHPAHYVYVQHSLVSLHMAYRPGAFDHFDTVLCCGPYHQDELQALAKQAGLPNKHAIAHSYDRLFQIIDQAHQRSHDQPPDTTSPHILVAPSWGPHGLIETLGDQLVRILLDSGYTVTLRPHPQTSRLSADRVDAIATEQRDNPRFTLETDVSGQDSLQQSDLMISDWSGAALEYGFGLNKPVLFIDVPKKVNNPNYQAIDLPPIEDWARQHIGAILAPDQLPQLPQAISELLNGQQSQIDKDTIRRRCLFEPEVDTAAIQHLLDILDHPKPPTPDSATTTP